MKKARGIIIVVAILAFATTTHAASDELIDGMVQKLFRGCTNLLTGCLELPAQTLKGYNEGYKGNRDNQMGGMLAGIVEGAFHTVGRTLSGAADIVSFWAANPEDNDGVGTLLDAEYVWEKGVSYDLCDPDFMQATVEPISRKFIRGLGNAVFGIAEIPGQMVKGMRNKSPDIGIIQGLWYFCSREVSGISDIATCFLPGSEENLGMAFAEEWPWDAIAGEEKTK